ncbi:hypothetical protein FO433_03165 [Weissella cibaria]|uniref:hypothetical protein n=1 Tax=Weissella cibaria TaxID=137591 RepID=UPI0011913973|nr:hypothetical protein [Weissella cibaria]TVV24860.1 hypothetical protein FO433_03165 [Weissella cibaria]
MVGMFNDAVVNDVIKKSSIQKISVTGNEARNASMTFAEYQKVVDFTFRTDLLTPSERAAAIMAFHDLRGAEIRGVKLRYFNGSSIEVAGQLTRDGYGALKH